MSYKTEDSLFFVKDENQLKLFSEYSSAHSKKNIQTKQSEISDTDLNSLSGRDWTILSKSVQIYNGAITDKRKLHGAAFPLSLAKHFINIYSKPKDYVLDPFAGVGTTLDAANMLERNALGIEINTKFAKMFYQGIDKKDGVVNSDYLRLLFNDNVENLNNHIAKNSIDLVVTSPPYSNLLNIIRKKFADKDFKGNKYKNQSRDLAPAYSENPLDFGNLPFEEYLVKIRHVMKNLFSVCKEGSYNVWVVRDYRNIKSNVPYVNLHGEIINQAIKEKWILWDMVIWDQSGQRKLVRLGGNVSRRFYFNIGHSFILVFRKNITGEEFENK